MPQSNQRGIETNPRPHVDPGGYAQPQSNQRGIETVDLSGGGEDNGPQSNQRGIETVFVIKGWGFWAGASIEPAWD